MQYIIISEWAQISESLPVKQKPDFPDMNPAGRNICVAELKNTQLIYCLIAGGVY